MGCRHMYDLEGFRVSLIRGVNFVGMNGLGPKVKVRSQSVAATSEGASVCTTRGGMAFSLCQELFAALFRS